MAAPNSPDNLDVSQHGEPFSNLVGNTPSSNLDYQSRGEPYAAAAAVIITCTLSGTIGSPTGSFTVAETETSTLSGSLGNPSASLTAAETETSTLAGSAPSPTASFTVAETITSTLNGSIGSPTGTFTADEAEQRGGWFEDQRSGSQVEDAPEPLHYGAGRRRTPKPAPEPVPPVTITCSLHGTLAPQRARLRAALGIQGTLQGRVGRPRARGTLQETIATEMRPMALKSASGALAVHESLEARMDGTLYSGVAETHALYEQFLAELEAKRDDLTALLLL